MPPFEPSKPRLALHTAPSPWSWSHWTALPIGLTPELRPGAQEIGANELPTNWTGRPLARTLAAMHDLIVRSMMAYGLHHLLITLNRLLSHQRDQRQQRAIRDASIAEQRTRTLSSGTKAPTLRSLALSEQPTRTVKSIFETPH